MTERADLIRVLEGLGNWRYNGDVDRVADTILEAGYRRPQPIPTDAEVQAEGSGHLWVDALQIQEVGGVDA